MLSCGITAVDASSPLWIYIALKKIWTWVLGEEKVFFFLWQLGIWFFFCAVGKEKAHACTSTWVDIVIVVILSFFFKVTETPVIRVLWWGFSWGMEWNRCCNQGVPWARFNRRKHGRFLQRDINSEVSSHWYVLFFVFLFEWMLIYFWSFHYHMFRCFFFAFTSRLRHPNGTPLSSLVHFKIFFFSVSYKRIFACSLQASAC